MFKFEEFISIGSKFNPRITVGKTGGFSFSSGFFNRYNLQDATAVKFYFDVEKKAIAFKFLKKQEAGAAKMVIRSKGGYAMSRSFLGKYNIDPKKFSGRYEPREITDVDYGTLFVIELKEKKDEANLVE